MRRKLFSIEYKKYLTNKSDELVAIVFSVVGLLGLILTLLGGRSFVKETIIVAFSSILYLALSRHKKEKTQSTDHSITAFALAFLGVLGMGVLVYLYSSFDVTLGAVIIALSGVILMIQICLMDSARFLAHRALILGEIFFISLVLRLLPTLTNPGFPGIDPWVLSESSAKISETGYVRSYFAYAIFPIYNILVSMASIVSSFDIRVATLLMIGFTESLSVFFVYIIAKCVWGHSSGLIASLFYALTPSSIFWGAYPIPMSIGITFVIFLTSLLLQSAESDSALPYRSLACLLVIVIVLTHTIASVIMIVILVVMALSVYLLEIKYGLSPFQGMLLKRIPKFNVIAILAFSSTLAYWTYVAYSFFSSTVITLASVLSLYYPKESIIQSYVVPTSFVKVFFDDLGPTTLYTLAMVSLFLVLSRREAKSAFFILAITGTLYGISVLLPLLGIVSAGTILPERWEPFLFAFLVCLSARALQYIGSRFSIRTAAAVFAIIGIMIVPSVVSYNPENLDRYFSPIFFLSSELVAADWAKGYLSFQDIASDVRYSVALGREARDFANYIISGNVTYVVKSLPNTILLVSNHSFQGGRIICSYERETLGWTGATFKLPYNIDSFLDNPYYNRFFSNSIVNSYGMVTQKEAR